MFSDNGRQEIQNTENTIQQRGEGKKRSGILDWRMKMGGFGKYESRKKKVTDYLVHLIKVYQQSIKLNRSQYLKQKQKKLHQQ
jgi:hypothetical protein